jgi:hypothetical protein
MRLLVLLLAFIAIVAATLPEIKDPVEAIATLKKLYELELISKDEFEERKSIVLDRLTGTPKDDKNGTVYDMQVKFLLDQFVDGLPRSYATILPTGENYWHTSIYLDVGAFDPWGARVELDSQIAIQERTLSTYGLNLYDGATWEIALALEGLADVALIYERNVLYSSGTGADEKVGGIINIRADSADYKYGVNKVTGDNLPIITLPGNTTRVIAVNGNPTTVTSKKQPGAFFYRMIGPKYTMTDPLVGDYGNSWKFPWPNNDTTTPWNIGGVIHWNDWKPITGENVWAAITGPLQVLWITQGKNLTKFLTFDETPDAVQLAISILPALKALQSPLGSLYHCPDGTAMFPPDSSEESNVSNENNFSAYAALRMLQEILAYFTTGTVDPVLVKALYDTQSLTAGLESWFSKYLLSDPYNGYRVVFQGGHVKFTGEYEPAPIDQEGGFAVDCQTWGMAVLGQAKIDQWYGDGTAYQLWQATKKFAGYYDPSGQLGGVGYTIVDGGKSNLIWSAEWTWGAIGACERLAYEYGKAGHADWAATLSADAASMVRLASQPLKRCANSGWCGGGLVQEDGSYLYANDRFFIPWGWYANPIGATCSTAWAVMHKHNFNPFVLGGGETSPLSLDR